MDDKDKQILRLKKQIESLTRTMEMIAKDDIFHIKIIRKMIKNDRERRNRK